MTSLPALADALLPCPFPHEGKDLLEEAWPAKGWYWVHCPCGATGPRCDSPERARRAWNRRLATPQPEHADLVKRLEEWAALVKENVTAPIPVSDEFRAEHREKAALLTEAITALRASDHQASVARLAMREEAARVCDEMREANKAWRTEEGDADKMAVLSAKNTAHTLGERIRALPASLDIEAAVEMGARAVWAHRHTARPGCSHVGFDYSEGIAYWDDERADCRETARAVLSALGVRP